MSREIRLRTCHLCEAMCGLSIEIDREAGEGGRASIVGIRGDEDDPFSRGHLCPKALALKDVHEDPDRLRRPLRRTPSGFEEIGWDEAFDLVGRRIDEIRAAHGDDALAVYQGNPTVHNLGSQLHGQLALRSLGTKNAFSATSVDQLPHMLAGLLMFGHQAMLPVPDLDRTGHLLMFGANPAVSNGSLMTSGGAARRLEAIRARGGRVVVVDPRRTETAALADAHHFVRPGTDALVLLAMLQVIFAEGLARPGRLSPHLRGLASLRTLAARFPPERVSARTGMEADTIRTLARDFARAPRAALYGRVGVSVQAFGGLACWLIVAINAVTGNLDEPGGVMFPTPAIDLVPHAARFGFEGSYGRYRSRVRGLPEFGDELPVSALAEEIEVPGDGRIRALITSAGNPVLSTPNGARLARALDKLDFMVSIDVYLNETTRHAHVILPPTFGVEADHYDVLLNLVAVRHVAKWSDAIVPRGEDQRHDWEIFRELHRRIRPRGVKGLALHAARQAIMSQTPAQLVDRMLRAGPYGDRFLPRPLASRLGHEAALSLEALRAQPHGVDLGALVPVLPERIYTEDRRIDLAPAPMLGDVPRLEALLDPPVVEGAPVRTLQLIGRRQLRNNNSWMHNAPRLVKGRPRCTLQMHPEDAHARGLVEGAIARVSSAKGEVEVPVEITDAMMRGVVCMPHGFGHALDGVRLGVARDVPGASMNDVTDEDRVDALAGTSVLNAIPVEVASVHA
jgi:anaerobic selenocysteine-containing dehydrogenase